MLQERLGLIAYRRRRCRCCLPRVLLSPHEFDVYQLGMFDVLFPSLKFSIVYLQCVQFSRIVVSLMQLYIKVSYNLK